MPVAFLRFLTFFAACVLSGLGGALAVRTMEARVGGDAAALHLAEGPALAVLAVAVMLLVQCGIAMVVGRLVGAASGMLSLGFGVLIFAAKTAEFPAAIDQGLSLQWLAVEDLVWGCGIAIAAAPVLRWSRARQWVRAPVTDRGFIRRAGAIVFVMAVALLLTWVVSRSAMKGQVIAAAVIGSMIATLLVRLLGAGPVWTLYTIPTMAAAAGRLLTAATTTSFDRATVGEGLSAVTLPMPQDFAAGALIGVTLGALWASSLVTAGEQETAAAPRVS